MLKVQFGQSETHSNCLHFGRKVDQSDGGGVSIFYLQSV